jgi:hypothetical protein
MSPLVIGLFVVGFLLVALSYAIGGQKVHSKIQRLRELDKAKAEREAALGVVKTTTKTLNRSAETQSHVRENLLESGTLTVPAPESLSVAVHPPASKYSLSDANNIGNEGQQASPGSDAAGETDDIENIEVFNSPIPSIPCSPYFF